MSNDNKQPAASDLSVSAGSEPEKRKMPAIAYYYDEDGERISLGRVVVNIEEPDMKEGEDIDDYWHKMNQRAKEWLLEDFEVDILDALISDSQNTAVE